MKTRSKLMAALAMLLVSTVMLTTASFAWFTISTAPEVKGLTTKVVVNDNLEIALHTDGTTVALPAATAAGQTGNNYTWGNLINLAASTKLDGTAGTNEYTTFMNDVVLRPATLTGTTPAFKAPTYAADGRIDAIDTAISDETGYGFGKLVTSETTPQCYGYFVDFWVRSNVAGNLVLTDAAERATDSEDGDTGAGSTVDSSIEHFEDGMNIAVKKLGNYDATGATWTAATNATIVGAKNDGDGTLSSENTFVTLTENQATLIRVYVYLEGANMTNADASTSADDSDVSVTGTVNLQFKLNGLTMDDMNVTFKTA